MKQLPWQQKIQNSYTSSIYIRVGIWTSGLPKPPTFGPAINLLKGFQILMGKLKEFGTLACLKINKQKAKMLTKI